MLDNPALNLTINAQPQQISLKDECLVLFLFSSAHSIPLIPGSGAFCRAGNAWEPLFISVRLDFWYSDIYLTFG